jgi:hypothetical protein
MHVFCVLLSSFISWIKYGVYFRVDALAKKHVCKLHQSMPLPPGLSCTVVRKCVMSLSEPTHHSASTETLEEKQALRNVTMSSSICTLCREHKYIYIYTYVGLTLLEYSQLRTHTIGVFAIGVLRVRPRHRHSLTQRAPMSNTQIAIVMYVHIMKKPLWTADKKNYTKNTTHLSLRI